MGALERAALSLSAFSTRTAIARPVQRSRADGELAPCPAEPCPGAWPFQILRSFRCNGPARPGHRRRGAVGFPALRPVPSAHPHPCAKGAPLPWAMCPFGAQDIAADEHLAISAHRPAALPRWRRAPARPPEQPRSLRKPLAFVVAKNSKGASSQRHFFRHP